MTLVLPFFCPVVAVTAAAAVDAAVIVGTVATVDAVHVSLLLLLLLPFIGSLYVLLLLLLTLFIAVYVVSIVIVFFAIYQVQVYIRIYKLNYLVFDPLGGLARHILPPLNPSQPVIAEKKFSCWGKEPSRSSLPSLLSLQSNS